MDGTVGRESMLTRFGLDRIPWVRVIVAVAAAMLIVTGLSIWAQRGADRAAGAARASVQSLQASDAAAAGLTSARTNAARRRVVTRASSQLRTAPPTAAVRATRSAL